MTNLQNYTTCHVYSFRKDPYVPTILKNHVYNLTTNTSLCGSVDLNDDSYDTVQADSCVVECKACARAYDKIKSAAAAETIETETVETETVELSTEVEHIISELSQAAMTVRYVQATCENDDQYDNLITVEQCNELDAIFERLQDIMSGLGK